MKIKPNIAVSDSGFIFHPNTGESFSMNPMGIQIFNLLHEGKSFEEIRTDIRDEYDVDNTTFEKDFQDFTALLQQYQITADETKD